MSAQADCFGIDDLLDLPNDDHFFSSSSSDSDPHHHHHHHHHHCLPPLLPQTSSSASASASTHFINTPQHDFTSDLCVPSDDVAELEWLSRFVDDSFSDLPAGEIAGALTFPNDASFSGRASSKRSRFPAAASASGRGGNTGWGSLSSTTTTTTTAELESPVVAKPKSKQREASPVSSGGTRRCTHCASEKTPQWRTGPMGPKTLCNACGVRYKSGRLVPEYRPAASPTFVLTQHSNSHRKVMELRRQKELIRQQQQPEEGQRHQQGQFYSHSHRHGFQVC
ncbi:GATA transcription factor [Parasponia andersonii]|uniref:GATA transcription factor n=1 Tax=Parasponia andersonii TaxID=3476 RepID=A0A2P5CJF9_PARAD|nr:GATA transcription factor [Parasponia andersonii]